MSRRPVSVLAAVAVAFSSAACVSTPKDRSGIALRRANLSLAFTDPSLKEPVPVEVIRRIIEVPAAAAFTPGRQLPTFKSPLPEICPATPPGSVHEEPAILKVSLPRPGTYLRVNDGTIVLSSGTAELTLPYPKVTTMQVRNVRREEPWTYYETFETLVPGVTQLTVYRYDDVQIQMTRRELTTSETGTSVFRPTPPVEVLALAEPGARWASTGLDVQARVAETVSGIVEGPKRIELCGEVVEAIPSRLEVHDVDVSGVTVYGTEAGKPLVQHWLPQYGGLIGRQVTHTSQFVRTEEGVVRVTFNVVSKLRGRDPVA